MNLSRHLNRQHLIAALFIGSVLQGCQSEQKIEPPAEAPLRPVKTLEAKKGGNLQRVLSANVISADSQELSFRISGSITALPVNVGDRLAAGDLVAELDKQLYSLAEKEARASLAQAEANYVNAESQYQRTRDLYSTEAASLSDLENAKANTSSARASRTLAREGLNSAKLNLSYAQLKTPTDSCQVVSVPVSVNQNIVAGQTIATTACGNQLRMRSSVPEALINNIELGMAVSAKLNTNGTTLVGNVIEIAVSNNQSSGYAVEIELEEPPANVKVGMAGHVTFDLSADEEHLLVPLVAVMSDSGGEFVFVAEAQGDHYQVIRQPVQTGELDNAGIEIVAGLTVGQQIIVAGMSRISEGMKVSLYSGPEH